MAYNTKPIVADVDGNPISQYYNKELDRYEPVEGQAGANKVVMYNADGSENNELSLIPILDKLSQLTGTVIDEEVRKSNELQRVELYDLIFQMLQDGDLKGDQGDIGLGLEFDWQGTSLGIRVEEGTEYVYVDLRGPQGKKGDTGSIENLDQAHIEDALGYLPPSPTKVSEDIENHNTNEFAHQNILTEIDSTNQQLNEVDADVKNRTTGNIFTSFTQLNKLYETNLTAQSSIEDIILSLKVRDQISNYYVSSAAGNDYPVNFGRLTMGALQEGTLIWFNAYRGGQHSLFYRVLFNIASNTLSPWKQIDITDKEDILWTGNTIITTEPQVLTSVSEANVYDSFVISVGSGTSNVGTSNGTFEQSLSTWSTNNVGYHNAYCFYGATKIFINVDIADSNKISVWCDTGTVTEFKRIKGVKRGGF